MADKKEPKKLLRIEIEPAENGGHTVTHHFREGMGKDARSHSGISFHHEEPEKHVFGPHEGHEMLAHVANHLHVPEPEEDDADDGESGDEEEGE